MWVARSALQRWDLRDGRINLSSEFTQQNFLLAQHRKFTESLWWLCLNCFVNSIPAQPSNSILRGCTVKSLIMPLIRLYVVQIPRCDLNGIRQLHKQQLKAWLSLFFLITSEVVSCIQSSAFTTNVCWNAFVMIKASLKSCLCPSHNTRHSHPRPLWIRPVTLQRQMAIV